MASIVDVADLGTEQDHIPKGIDGTVYRIAKGNLDVARELYQTGMLLREKGHAKPEEYFKRAYFFLKRALDSSSTRVQGQAEWFRFQLEEVYQRVWN